MDESDNDALAVGEDSVDEALEQLLCVKKVALFIDGLDEVALKRQTRKQLCQWVEELGRMAARKYAWLGA